MSAANDHAGMNSPCAKASGQVTMIQLAATYRAGWSVRGNVVSRLQAVIAGVDMWLTDVIWPHDHLWRFLRYRD